MLTESEGQEVELGFRHSSCEDDRGRWCVVHVQSRAEGRAIENLERQGFDTYCPWIQKTVRHARKQEIVLAPVFPGYVFLRLDLRRDRWRCINSTRGVLRLITVGDCPCHVPSDVVEALQAKFSTVMTASEGDNLRVGDAVEITHGPFSNLIGTLEALNAAGRVRVLLDVLGRSVGVFLDRRVIQPAI